MRYILDVLLNVFITLNGEPGSAIARLQIKEDINYG